MPRCDPVPVTHPPAAPYAPPPPTKPAMPKSVRNALLALGAVVLFLLSAVAVYALNGGGDNKVTLGAPTATKASTGHEIRFEVTISTGAKGTVNWSTIGDSAILTDEPLPWSKTVTLKEQFGLVGVTASAPAGRLTCRLLVDGKEVKKNESDLVVNCSDTVSP